MGDEKKTKLRSYGEGVELPVVKYKEGLFKKPEFHLADEKFDDAHPLRPGQFTGQDATELKGPSRRAIKGKGRRSGHVYVDVTDNPDETQSSVSYLEHLSPANKRMKDMVDPLTGITSGKIGPIDKQGYPIQMHTPGHEPTERDKMHVTDFGKATVTSTTPDAGDTQGFEERKPMTESQHYSDLEKSAPTLSPRQQRQHDRKKKKQFRQQGRQATKSMNELMSNPITHKSEKTHKHSLPSGKKIVKRPTGKRPS